MYALFYFGEKEVIMRVSGREAWILKSKGVDVEWSFNFYEWFNLTDSEFMNWQTERFISVDSSYKFRLKNKKDYKID